jgi:hypothetical protein
VKFTPVADHWVCIDLVAVAIPGACVLGQRVGARQANVEDATTDQLAINSALYVARRGPDVDWVCARTVGAEISSGNCAVMLACVAADEAPVVVVVRQAIRLRWKCQIKRHVEAVPGQRSGHPALRQTHTQDHQSFPVAQRAGRGLLRNSGRIDSVHADLVASARTCELTVATRALEYNSLIMAEHVRLSCAQIECLAPGLKTYQAA